LKDAHLLRCVKNSSLHLSILEQPAEKDFFNNLLILPAGIHPVKGL